MAIGTTWVLLILVTSLAISYIRESRLSRYSYDEVIASTAAEGEFEYAMLKVRNHRDGFQDTTFSGELDGNLLDLSTPRSVWLHSQYQISAASTAQIFTLSGQQHLIVPLFVGTGTILSGFSKNPNYETGVDNTRGLNISGISGLSWAITAMSGSESIAITGVGDIGDTTLWKIRVKAIQCYDENGILGLHPTDLDSLGNCTGVYSDSQSWETVAYSYDVTESISLFLSTKIDPYFIIYNADNMAHDITFSSTTPFALPTLILRATASKWESSQVFQFVEDKGKYYDALKYGVYNTGP